MDVSNRRIVILGKSGVGKSSVANTIFGEELFKIGCTAKSVTSECRAETKSVNGRNITLFDTPGLFDIDRPEKEMKSEMVKCITEFTPGLHAFLILLKVERFTEQEQAVITQINQYFSEETFKYATVLFTHGDQLEEEQTIEDFIRDNEHVSDLVKKCGGRCHVIDNKYWKNNQQDEYRSNQFQVKELLNTIEQMIKANNGRCYTNEMLQAVEAGIKQEEEPIRQSSGDMSQKEIREKAKDIVSNRLLINLAGITTGALLGALFGVIVMVKVVPLALGTGLAFAKNTVRTHAEATATDAETRERGAALKILATAEGVAALKIVATTEGVAALKIVATAEGGALLKEVATADGAAVLKEAAAADGAAVLKEAAAADGAAVLKEAAAAARAAGKSAIVLTATCAVVGGVAGYCAAQEAETPFVAAERAAEAVKSGSNSIVDVTKSWLIK